MTEQLIPHPDTGEVATAQEWCREWVRINTALQEATAEVGRLTAVRAEIEAAVRCACQDGPVDTPAATVCLVPPMTETRQTIDRVAVMRHREAIEGLGLLTVDQEVVEKVRWPTTKRVRQEAGRLERAGVPVAEILPPPQPQPLHLEIVPKET